MKWNCIKTEDGSTTLFNEHLNESYHSKFGAIAESEHVFINTGLKQALLKFKSTLNILEIGFGTGLNTYLTFLFPGIEDINTTYFAIEPNPLSSVLIQQMNYHKILQSDNIPDLFQKIHEAIWNKTIMISDFYHLHKSQKTLESSELIPDYFHLVYFDAIKL